VRVMELLGDVGQVKARFGPYGDNVNLSARWGHVLCQTYDRLEKSFWTHPIVLLRDVGRVEARFGPFRDSVNLDAIHSLHGMCNWLKNHFRRYRWNS
jgi:hypothetical protein